MRREMSFLDLSLAIGGHLGNKQIKKLPLPVEMMTLAYTEHKSIKV